MNRFALLLSLAFAFVSSPALADVMLRPNVVVDGDVVKLGDLFDNTGAKADTAVARAPAPGRRVTVDADWLTRIANIYGVNWRPQNVFEQATIERSGVTVGRDQIEAELQHALAAQGAGDNIQVELANRSMQLVVPVGASLEVGVRDLAYDDHYKRFTATVEVPANAPGATRVRVTGRVYPTVQLPVLARPLGRGEVITTRDLVWSRVREDSIRRDILTDADQIVGMTPRQTLRGGQMISASELQKPLAVLRGALVTMVLKHGAMTLSTQGRAIEQGSVGDVIRITNTHSNLTVEGKIEAPNMVSVSLIGATALAN